MKRTIKSILIGAIAILKNLNPNKLAPLVFCLLICLTALAQNSIVNSSSIRLHIETFIGVNFNYSDSKNIPLNATAFYEFIYPPNSPSPEYNQLIAGLDKSEANWTLKPQPEIGLRIYYDKNDLFGYGLNFVYTSNNSTATLRSETQNEKAELSFVGKENRIMFQPITGFKINRLHAQVNLTLGLGFNKRYDTQISITDGNGFKRIIPYHNDHFYTVDYSLGVGCGIVYDLKDKINLGISYNAYLVNTSPYIVPEGIAIKIANGYLNHSISLSLGYDLQ